MGAQIQGRTVRPPRIPRTCVCGGAAAGRIHRHPDGSHWCDQCHGYAGASGAYGTDMPLVNGKPHPAKCKCPPCPGQETMPGVRVYDHNDRIMFRGRWS